MQDNLSSPTTAARDATGPSGKLMTISPRPTDQSASRARDAPRFGSSTGDLPSRRESGNRERLGILCGKASAAIERASAESYADPARRRGGGAQSLRARRPAPAAVSFRSHP